MNQRQQQAVEHEHGPVLVIAGAGTGKTTVLTQRIVRLIETGLARPDEILAVTYSNPAAAEMRKRVREALEKVGAGDAAGEVQIRTFHDYGRNVLDRNGRKFQLIEDIDLRIYLRRRIHELNLKHFIGPENLGKFLWDLMEFIRRCQDDVRTPAEYADYVAQMDAGAVPLQRTSKGKKLVEQSREAQIERCREVAHVFTMAEQYLREEGWGMFGHMISGCLELLQQDAKVLAAERTRARFILADEFQDANYAQVLLLKLLAGEEGNIFAVGDPDQSIYKFRGASSEAFDMFRREFPRTKVIHLDQNQRSRTPILQCAHLLIQENPDVFSGDAASLYQRTPLISARDVEAAKSAVPSVAAAVELITYKKDEEEARDVVQRIQELRRAERCQYRDIAVLYRSHSHRDEVIEALEREQIPFTVSGQNILQTADVRDLLAAAWAVVSPVSTTTMLRVAALPRFGIDGIELQAALATSRDISFTAVLAKVAGGSALLSALEQARERLRQNSKAAPALRAVALSLGMELGNAGESFLRFAWEWQRKPMTAEGTLREFVEYMEEFAEAGGEIPLVRVDGEADANQTPLDGILSPDAVQVMTAHASKGLEFRHVFVIRSASGSFPSNYKEPAVEFPVVLSREESVKTTDAKTLHAQEERRLFYVAMTRARDTLRIYGRPAGAPEPAAKFPRNIHEADKGSQHHRLRRILPPQPVQASIFAEAEEAHPAVPRLHQWMELPPYRAAEMRLSASAIDRYERCPLQFKLQRDWKLPAEPSAALQYGGSMHRVLCHYYQSLLAGQPMALPELQQFFREDLERAGLEEDYQRSLYETRGCRDLEAFVTQAAEQPVPEVLHTEAMVSFQLDDVTINGRLDRVDRLPNGQVRIVDYKTGKPKTEEFAAGSLQLALYALAAAAEWGYDVAESVLHNLQDGTVLPVRYTEAELELARARVRKAAEGIRAGHFAPIPKPQTCAWCDFYAICPETEKRVYGLVEIEPIDLGQLE